MDMLQQWWFRLKTIFKRLSVRATLFALLALVSSLAAVLFDEYVPNEFANLAGSDAVDGIISTMASSMLIVATFAVSTMVSAYSVATQQATPRATSLIKDDSDSHLAISIFIGAFVYSIVSLVALQTEYYGSKGRVILLIFSVIVLISVLWALIRWVDEVRNMGSVQTSIKKVECVVMKALQDRSKRPNFDCSPLKNYPKEAQELASPVIGHIQNIDVSHLHKICTESKLSIYVTREVGSFVHPSQTLALVKSEGGHLDDKVKKDILEAFAIGSSRTFDADPLYGITVLSGIGIKALSPSLNDPGTAVDVVGSLVRVLHCWKLEAEECPVKYKHVYFPELKISQLFHEAFYHLSVHGSRDLQVSESLKSAFEIFLQDTDKEVRSASGKHLDRLLSRTQEELTFGPDQERLQRQGLRH